MREIIIASQSPRRRELMEQAGYEFTVIPSTVEEVITKTLPYQVVEELSGQKARDVYDITIQKNGNTKDILVIGADTVVALGDKILGKPKSKEDAVNMLMALQGNTHQVYTGVTLVWNYEGQTCEKSFYECTRVTFYPMSMEEIESYVNSNDPMDKAGAYGIQGRCAVYIKEICGDYNNVVGLPIARLYQELKEVK